MSEDDKGPEPYMFDLGPIKLKYILLGCTILLFVNMLVQAILGNAFSAFLNLLLFLFLLWERARLRARGQL